MYLVLIGREPPLNFFRKSGVRFSENLVKILSFWSRHIFGIYHLLYGQKLGWFTGFQTERLKAIDPSTWMSAILDDRSDYFDRNHCEQC